MSSKFDQIYRSILLTKFFTQGWGKPENLRKIFEFRKILSKRESCMKLVDKNYPITIKKQTEYGDHTVLEAEFVSPVVHHLPGLLPKESEKAYFQMLLPKNWTARHKPVCVHLAGTGDHGYWRRRILLAKPLLHEYGIASILLENPFYGSRKPKDQIRSSLRNVSDLFLMGACLIMESNVIFQWVEQQGFGPVGVHGISMGGHMASLAAVSWDQPIPLIPCLSWSTASGVFTQGVLSGAINWDMLKNQYFSNQVFRNELFNMINSPEGYFQVYHEGGLHFAQNFPKSLSRVEELKTQNKKIDITNVPRPNYSDSSTNLDPKKGIATADNKIREGNMNDVMKRIELSTEAVNKAKSISDSKINNLLESLNGVKIADSLAAEKKKSVGKFGNLLTRFHRDKSKIQGFSPRELTPIAIRPELTDKSKPVIFQPYVKAKDSLTWEALQFMRGIMDECTHLGNFEKPVDTSLTIVVSAEKDAYMPRDGIIPLDDIWPGSELRSIKHGHIGAVLFNQRVFRKAIHDSFDRCIKKYHSDDLNDIKGRTQSTEIRNAKAA